MTLSLGSANRFMVTSRVAEWAAILRHADVLRKSSTQQFPEGVLFLKWGRVILVTTLLLLLAIPGLLLCLFRPFHGNLVYLLSRGFKWLTPLLGFSVELRGLQHLKLVQDRAKIFVSNHQHTLDLFTCPWAFQPNTVTVGKKSLKWIPVFGLFYWFSGNIMIDRANRSRAAGTIEQAARRIKERQINVWLFPEGTRSYGRGLLPFKSGAFRMAKRAAVPIVPVCISDTVNQLDLSRWHNGKVIIEFLPPVMPNAQQEPRQLTDQVYQDMQAVFNKNSAEAHQTVSSK